MSGQVYQDPATGRYFQEVSGPGGLVPVGGGSTMPWNAPPQQAAGNDPNSQMLGMLLPLITTLPAFTGASTAAAVLKAKITAITPPPAVTGTPTLAEHNALRDYAVAIQGALKETVGNDEVAFEALRKQAILSIISPMLSQGGGGGSMIAIVLLMVFGGL